MASSPWERTLPRRLGFESCEPRCVMTAQVVVPEISVAGSPQTGPTFAENLESVRAVLHDQYGLTGAGQTVVVIDSGIAYDHRALGAGFGPGFQVVGGWDFTGENDADPYDDPPAGFHGTHVAGIIGSQDAQHPGLAPGVDLVALRVFDDIGRSDFAWIEQALRWVHEHRLAFEHPITTVNLSIGLPADAQLDETQRLLEDELAQLARDGIFVSVAAGNGYNLHPVTGLSYPASSPHVVAVGSVDAGGEVSTFSRRDPRMLLAPGEDILSTITDFLFDFNRITDDWFRFSGTSQAAPYVAGAAVLVRQSLERSGTLQPTPAQILNVLRSTADPVYDRQTNQSYTRVNLLKAIESILGEPAGVLRWEQTAQGLSRLRVPDGVQSVRLELGPNQQLTLDGDPVAFVQDMGANVELQLPATAQLEIHAGGVPVSVYARDGNWRVEQGDHTWEILGMRDGMLVSAPGRGDQIRIYGTPDGDHFTSRAAVAVLTSGAYRSQARNVDRVFVFGGGGDDVAYLTGGASDDLFVSGSGFARLSDSQRMDYVEGFERVFAYGGPGGLDRAILAGSAQDDTLVSRPEYTRLSNFAQLRYLESFDRIYATAGEGGVDRAFLYGSSGGDQVYRRGDEVLIDRAITLSVATAFARTYAFGEGGSDWAWVSATERDERVWVEGRALTMGGAESLVSLDGFAHGVVDAAWGTLTPAELRVTAASETVYLDREQMEVRAADFTWALRGFRQMRLIGDWGSTDRVVARDGAWRWGDNRWRRWLATYDLAVRGTGWSAFAE